MASRSDSKGDGGSLHCCMIKLTPSNVAQYIQAQAPDMGTMGTPGEEILTDGDWIKDHDGPHALVMRQYHRDCGKLIAYQNRSYSDDVKMRMKNCTEPYRIATSTKDPLLFHQLAIKVCSVCNAVRAHTLNREWEDTSKLPGEGIQAFWYRLTTKYDAAVDAGKVITEREKITQLMGALKSATNYPTVFLDCVEPPAQEEGPHKNWPTWTAIQQRGREIVALGVRGTEGETDAEDEIATMEGVTRAMTDAKREVARATMGAKHAVARAKAVTTHAKTECPNCGSSDHIKRECPRELIKCRKCFKFGHMERFCWEGTERDSGDNSDNDSGEDESESMIVTAYSCGPIEAEESDTQSTSSNHHCDCSHTSRQPTTVQGATEATTAPHLPAMAATLERERNWDSDSSEGTPSATLLTSNTYRVHDVNSLFGSNDSDSGITESTGGATVLPTAHVRCDSPTYAELIDQIHVQTVILERLRSQLRREGEEPQITLSVGGSGASAQGDAAYTPAPYSSRGFPTATHDYMTNAYETTHVSSVERQEYAGCVGRMYTGRHTVYDSDGHTIDDEQHYAEDIRTVVQANVSNIAVRSTDEHTGGASTQADDQHVFPHTDCALLHSDSEDELPDSLRHNERGTVPTTPAAVTCFQWGDVGPTEGVNTELDRAVINIDRLIREAHSDTDTVSNISQERSNRMSKGGYEGFKGGKGNTSAEEEPEELTQGASSKSDSDEVPDLLRMDELGNVIEIVMSARERNEYKEAKGERCSSSTDEDGYSFYRPTTSRSARPTSHTPSTLLFPGTGMTDTVADFERWASTQTETDDAEWRNSPQGGAYDWLTTNPGDSG
ncbi:hypothetical protein B484DRAFT_401146, partial [Ochromonadaceae sp. CCMP2298]